MPVSTSIVKTKTGETPLHMAIICGHEARYRAILSHHPTPSSRDQEEKATLDTALVHSHWRTAMILLQHGAVSKVKDDKLKRTLGAAALYRISEVVLKLIKAGAERQKKDEYGMTPFQTAKQEGREKTAQILLEHAMGHRRVEWPIDGSRVSALSLKDDEEEDEEEIDV